MLGHGHWPVPRVNMYRGSDQSSSVLTQTTTTTLSPVVRPGLPGCPHGPLPRGLRTRVSRLYRLRFCMMLMTDVAGCCRCLLFQIDFEGSAEWGDTSGKSTLKVLHSLIVDLVLLVVSLLLLCCSFCCCCVWCYLFVVAVPPAFVGVSLPSSGAMAPRWAPSVAAVRRRRRQDASSAVQQFSPPGSDCPLPSPRPAGSPQTAALGCPTPSISWDAAYKSH